MSGQARRAARGRLVCGTVRHQGGALVAGARTSKRYRHTRKAARRSAKEQRAKQQQEGEEKRREEEERPWGAAHRNVSHPQERGAAHRILAASAQSIARPGQAGLNS